MKISLGTFKDNGEGLVTFLEPRVGTKPSLSGSTVEIEDESMRKGVKPRHVKTYVKRFLYMKGVRKNYRVFVSGKELTIQEIELGKKGEEEEKKEEAETKEERADTTEEKEEKQEKTEAKEEEEAKEEKPKKTPKKPRAKKKVKAE